jgi:hypothetical protein
MYDMAEVMTQSGYTEEEVFDCGISGQIAFVVVVPEIGACRVPPVALSHFMAGADDYTADGMPEHWSNQPSGPWTIRRDRLRILADSWESHSDQCHTLADALDRQQADDEAATLRAPPPSTRTPGFYTLEEAARVIAAQEAFNAFQENELRKDLLEGDRDGSLTVRDGGGHRKFAPIRPSIPRDFVELVTPTDVNNWAIHKGFQWRWQTEAQAAPAVTPEPQGPPVVAGGVSGGALPIKAAPVAKVWVMKRAALVKKHVDRWPTIGRDLQDASENGLSKAAKALGHGEWYESAALDWARQRGKLEEEKQVGPANSVFALAGTQHKIKC